MLSEQAALPPSTSGLRKSGPRLSSRALSTPLGVRMPLSQCT